MGISIISSNRCPACSSCSALLHTVLIEERRRILFIQCPHPLFYIHIFLYKKEMGGEKRGRERKSKKEQERARKSKKENGKERKKASKERKREKEQERARKSKKEQEREWEREEESQQ